MRSIKNKTNDQSTKLIRQHRNNNFAIFVTDGLITQGAALEGVIH